MSELKQLSVDFFKVLADIVNKKKEKGKLEIDYTYQFPEERQYESN